MSDAIIVCEGKPPVLSRTGADRAADITWLLSPASARRWSTTQQTTGTYWLQLPSYSRPSPIFRLTTSPDKYCMLIMPAGRPRNYYAGQRKGCTQSFATRAELAFGRDIPVFWHLRPTNLDGKAKWALICRAHATRGARADSFRISRERPVVEATALRFQLARVRSSAGVG
ncbi:hypothetical protein OPT61_g2430 [Boeremia exigua]|uniref:Uncharacterized protein n=1 Tax=Boeremia exigua TaxID=749465 RepID=A0ACC2ILK0_9PLEO|nr:hypothetical protein OPT61_g2430 [Boeremia exigua]